MLAMVNLRVSGNRSGREVALLGHSADLGNDSMLERTSMRTGHLSLGLFLVSALLLAGCATVVVPLESQLVSERLPFIRDGKTSMG